MLFPITIIAGVFLFVPFKKANGQTSSIAKEVFGPLAITGPFMYEFNNGNNKKFDALFAKYGAQYGIDPKILKSIAIQESSLNPNARALTSSAYGLMQITKAAAADAGESWAGQNIPETAIRTGAKYLHLLMTQNGFTINQAIQAYYAGAGTIRTAAMGGTFSESWQPEAYKFAVNVYEPKIVQRAAQISLTA